MADIWRNIRTGLQRKRGHRQATDARDEGAGWLGWDAWVTVKKAR